MKNSRRSISIGSIIVVIIIFNLFTNLVSSKNITSILVYALPVLFIFLVNTASNNKHKQPPEENKFNNDDPYEDYHYHQPKTNETHECEYCGERNPVNTEYCQNCGAKQLYN